MADDSGETLHHTAAEAPEESIVVSEELEIKEPTEPTEKEPVSSLSIPKLSINHIEQESNGETHFIIHDQEPEVSFEGHTESNNVPASPWKSGMTPRALQVEASHAEEIEKLRAELETMRADSARLRQAVQEKDAVIAEQQSKLNTLSQSSAPVAVKPSPTKKVTAAVGSPKKLPPAATGSVSAAAAKKKVSVSSVPVVKKVAPVPSKKTGKVTAPKAPPAPVSVGKTQPPFSLGDPPVSRVTKHSLRSAALSSASSSSSPSAPNSAKKTLPASARTTQTSKVAPKSTGSATKSAVAPSLPSQNASVQQSNKDDAKVEPSAEGAAVGKVEEDNSERI